VPQLKDRGQTPGVYLLHFNEKLRHAGHYLGSAADIDVRIAKHRSGRGARLTAVIKELGIGFVIARVWFTETVRDARLLEAKFKRSNNPGGRRCPVCRGERK